MTRPFSGWHMTAILVTFFGVVIAVNTLMATLAVRTFGGTVVENSYVASQEYNGWLAAARRQQQLGWKIETSLDSSRHVRVELAGPGASISGVASHPLGRAPDIALAFGGDRRSNEALPAGRWTVHLLVRRGHEEARVVTTLL